MDRDATRRRLLKSIGSTGIVGALAGCTGDGGDGDGGGSDGGGGGGGGSDGGGGGSGGGSDGGGGGGGSDGGGGGGGGSTSWRYATHVEGSGSEAIVNAWSVIFEKHSDQLSLSPQTTNGLTHNLRLMSQDRVKASIAHTISALWGWEGSGEFEEKPIDVRPVQGHPANQIIQHAWVVDKDKDIETVADLEGRTIALGPPAGTIKWIARQILEAEGIADSVNGKLMTFVEGKSALRAGDIDGFMTGIINFRTNAATMEVFETMNAGWAYPSDSALEKLSESPFFRIKTIDTSHPQWPDAMDTERDEFRMQTVDTFGVLDPALPEDLVYHSLKILHEHQEEMVDITPLLWGFGFGTVEIEGQEFDRWGMKGMSEIPFHPGAARYLKEIDEWDSSWSVYEG